MANHTVPGLWVSVCAALAVGTLAYSFKDMHMCAVSLLSYVGQYVLKKKGQSLVIVKFSHITLVIMQA